MDERRPQPRSRTWPSRRTVCILLLFFSAVLAANWWIVAQRDTFNWHDSGKVANMDFAQYYAGGTNWDLGLDPYRNHPNVPGAIMIPRVNQPWISGYIYPPTLLPVFGALAHLRYESARVAWLIIDVVAFALVILVAVLVAKGRRLETLTAAVVLTVISYPFYWHVTWGQIDMVTAALTISAFLLYPRWHGWPSALLFALAISAKVTPLVVLVALVLCWRDWRFLLKTLACGVGVFALSLLAVDWSLFVEYVGRILPAISASDPSQYNQTPLRFWSHYPAATKVISLLGYAALAFLAWMVGTVGRRLPRNERPVDARTEGYALLLLSVLMMLFFSPLAWQQAYVWPIVPLALLIVSPPPRRRPAAALGLLCAAAVLLSVQIVAVRPLDMANMIGAGLGIVTLMLYYLPLDPGSFSRTPQHVVGSGDDGGVAVDATRARSLDS
jgi:hypothetical protein